MNRIHRSIWNACSCTFVAVAENTNSRGKPASAGPAARVRVGRAAGEGSERLAAGPAPAWLALSLMLAFAPTLQALPTGGQVAAGSVTLASGAATTTVTQTSQNAVINWQSFGIAAGQGVNFVQPNAGAVALNRVLGPDPSAILGSLTANGRVFLVNPNGILFGKGASVNVGGLVASTLDIADADLMAGAASGRYAFSGSSRAAVLNQGAIVANGTGAGGGSGGFVALLGAKVSNEGVVSARLGSVALAAGRAITLDLAGDGLLQVVVNQGAVDALVDNGGLIRADGGQVLLTAQAAGDLLGSTVNHSGLIQAQTLESHQGVIRLLGGMKSGTVALSGTLDASAPNGGDGGFVETSAARVQVADSARVSTLAALGQTGRWLVDPQDFTVAATGGDISGATLGANLAATSVELQSSGGGAAGAGNVNINDAVSWSANTRLTLTASNDVKVNAAVSASGAAAEIWINPNQANGGEPASGAGSFRLGPIGQGAVINLPNVSASSSTALVIGGEAYTVINSLGVAGDASGGTLQGMNGNLGGRYALGSDLAAAATSGWNGGLGFSPIGSSAAPFVGSLDGLGHAVSGLVINRAGSDRIGLFAALSQGGRLQNMGLTSASVSGGNQVGAWVGDNVGGRLDNVYATGNVSGNGQVGGLLGSHQAGVVNDAYATVMVNGSRDVGGLVGANLAGVVSNSFYNLDAATINGVATVGPWGLYGAQFQDWVSHGKQLDITRYASLAPATGGYFDISSVQGLKDLLGFAQKPALSFRLGANLDLTATPGLYIPYFAGSFDGNRHVVSNLRLNRPGESNLGLFGTLASGGAVTNLRLTLANVSGADHVGALVGHVESGTIVNSFATGSVSGNNAVGGLVGYDQSGSISNAYATASVSGASGVGGLVGTLDRATVSNVYATGSVSGSAYLGGLIGSNTGGAIVNAYATGAVSGTVSGSHDVGGLVGANTSGSITGSYATGNVVGSSNYNTSGASRIGGLAGSNQGGTISNSYASGSVVGNGGGDYYTSSNSSQVGGLVGSNDAGTISNAYATGGVSGNASYYVYGDSSQIGGLAGSNQSGTITDAYATGSVSGNNSYYGNSRLVGGLVGSNQAGTIANSYATGSVIGSASYNNSNANTGYVGGLAGSNQAGSITDSYATGTVGGNYGYGNTSHVGGLVGDNAAGAIRNSFYNVDGVPINGSYTFAAWGLYGAQFLDWVGHGKSLNPANYASLAPTASGAYEISSVQGLKDLLGFAQNPALKFKLAADIDLSPAPGLYIPAFAGSFDGNAHVIANLRLNRPGDSDLGLFGTLLSGAVLSNLGVTSASVAGGDRVGALVGSNQSASIDNAYATGSVSGNSAVGGLVGYNQAGTVVNSNAAASVSGGANVGGLVGTNNAGTIGNAYATGAVSGTSNGSRIGGLVGLNQSGSITASYANGSVVGSSDYYNNSSSYVGGLVGSNQAGTVVDSYATGSVSGTGSNTYYNNNNTSSYIGGLAGANESGTITRSHATGSVNGTGGNNYGNGNYVGGLVGNNLSGTIADSYATGSVGGTGSNNGSSSYVGGLAGANPSGSISGSYATGGVSGSSNYYNSNTGSYLGGLVGSNQTGRIADSYATGSVGGSYYGSNNYVGGLAGDNQSGTISNAYATGSVRGSNYIGGLTGANQDGTVTNSHYNIDTAPLNGASVVAAWGLYGTQFQDWVGHGKSLDIANYASLAPNSGGAYEISSVQGLKDLLGFAQVPSLKFSLAADIDLAQTPGLYIPSFAGSFDGNAHVIANLRLNRPGENNLGMFGELLNGASLSNVGLTSANVSGADHIGALVGINRTATVSRAYATGNVSGNNMIGGLVGVNDHGAVSDVYATVSVSGARDVGGLVGSNSGGAITNAYATGSVNGSGSRIGGLAGDNLSGTIFNAHATGSVSGGSQVGGLVGVNEGGTVADAYALGSVTGSSQIGGLIGADVAGTVRNSYYSIDTATLNGTPTVTVLGLYNAQLQGWVAHGRTLDVADYSSLAPAGGGVYQISSLQGLKDLLGFAQNPTLKFRLGANIDLAQVPGLYIPLFAGSFDGNGHVITNLRLSRAGENNLGLFGTLASGASLSNLGVTSASVSGGDHIGVLVGNNQSATISNAYATGNVSGHDAVGGLVGYNQSGTISNAYATASVNGASAVGGLVGYNARGTISDAYVKGSVSGTASVGGLVGTNQGGLIANTYASGAINGVSEIGGLVGTNQAGTITDAYAVGSVNGSTNVGGLVGANPTGTVAYSYATGNVSGGTNVGGLLGNSDHGMVTSSFANGSVSGSTNVGGLAGASQSDLISGSYASGSVSGSTNIGGLVGYSDHGAIDNSFASGTVSGTSNGSRIGGLVGANQSGTISASHATGSVVGSTDYWNFSSSYVGGLVGSNQAGTIADSYATGSVSGISSSTYPYYGVTSSYIGGLAGANDSGTITRSYASGSVNGTGSNNNYANGSYVGGLVGNNQTGTIADSYATGNVVGSNSYYGSGNYVGGLVGNNQTGSISGSYATGGVSGSNYYGTGNYVGGLAGANQSGSISGSYATGNVSGSSYFYNTSNGSYYGGLVGFNVAGRITDSYATGSVAGGGGAYYGYGYYVGGLVGSDQSGTFSNTYASGAVRGNYTGGLVGYTTGGTFNNSFWDQGSSGQSGSAAGTGLSSAQMQTQSSFSSAGNGSPGWDFSSTWVLYEGHSAPLLRSFMTPLTVSASSASKTYDGQAFTGGASLAYSITPNQNLLGTATLDVPQGAVNAGRYAITPGGLYSNQQGYLISYANGQLTVAPKPLALTGADKVYDGNTSINLATARLDGVIAGDNVALGSQSLFASRNVGSAIPVALELVGSSAANYSAAGQSAGISAKPIAVVATGNNKVYDGSLAATVTLASTGVVAGDLVSFASTGATFADKNVAAGKAIAVTGISAGGIDSANYSLSNNAASTTADISRKAITVAATGNNKVYDGSSAATVTLVSTGVVAGDLVSFASTGATFADKNVATGKAIAVAGISTGGTDSANYSLTSNIASTTADISQKAITVAATGNNTVYDGNTGATVGLASTGLVAGDLVSFTSAGATFADKNVATGKAISVTGISTGGNDGANYSLTSNIASTTADISQKAITVAATGNNKVYDGSTAATVGLASTGVVAGDNLSFASIGATFADRNAGLGKAVAVTGISAGGADVANYSLLNTSAATFADITKAHLTVTANDQTRAYGQANPVLTTTLSGFVGGETLATSGVSGAALASTAAAATSAVGSLPITASAGTLAATNYDFSRLVDGMLTITPALISFNPISLSGTRVYDGTVNVAASIFTLGGLVNNEQLTLSGVGTVANKNVGVNKAVSLGTLALGNGGSAAAGSLGLASNYSFTGGTFTATITPAPLALAGISAAGKVYDGSTTASLVGTARVTPLAGDAVTVAGSAAGSFANKNVGTAKAVTVSGYALAGADAANYSLVQPAGLTAAITAKAITVAATGVNKVYDGNVNDAATLSSTGVVAGDAVVFADTSATFANKNVGNAKVVSVAGISKSGADAANYTLGNTTASTVANITPATLTVTTAKAADKVYNGSTAATVSGAKLAGLIGTDAVTLGNATTGTFANKDVGTAKAVNTAMTIAGTGAANYLLAQPTGLTASITPKPITVVATGVNKAFDGTVNAAVNLSSTGLVLGDLVSLGYTSASFATAAVGTNKSISVLGINKTGSNAANYSLSNTTATARANITAAVVLATIAQVTFQGEGGPVKVVSPIVPAVPQAADETAAALASARPRMEVEAPLAAQPIPRLLIVPAGAGAGEEGEIAEPIERLPDGRALLRILGGGVRRPDSLVSSTAP